MLVLILLIFVSAVLSLCGVFFFLWHMHQRTSEHTDRLAILPLDEK